MTKEQRKRAQLVKQGRLTSDTGGVQRAAMPELPADLPIVYGWVHHLRADRLSAISGVRRRWTRDVAFRGRRELVFCRKVKISRVLWWNLRFGVATPGVGQDSKINRRHEG